MRPEEISSAEAHPVEPSGGRTAYQMRPNNWRGKVVNALKERPERAPESKTNSVFSPQETYVTLLGYVNRRFFYKKWAKK